MWFLVFNEQSMSSYNFQLEKTWKFKVEKTNNEKCDFNFVEVGKLISKPPRSALQFQLKTDSPNSETLQKVRTKTEIRNQFWALLRHPWKKRTGHARNSITSTPDTGKKFEYESANQQSEQKSIIHYPVASTRRQIRVMILTFSKDRVQVLSRQVGAPRWKGIISTPRYPVVKIWDQYKWQWTYPFRRSLLHRSILQKFRLEIFNFSA